MAAPDVRTVKLSEGASFSVRLGVDRLRLDPSGALRFLIGVGKVGRLIGSASLAPFIDVGKVGIGNYGKTRVLFVMPEKPEFQILMNTTPNRGKLGGRRHAGRSI